jgi:hypothetical protein
MVVSRWEKKRAMNLKKDAEEEEDNLFDPAITVSLAIGMTCQNCFRDVIPPLPRLLQVNDVNNPPTDNQLSKFFLISLCSCKRK